MAFAPRRCIEHGLLDQRAEPFTQDATTLFVDLAGFTPLTARLARFGSRGTEELSALLRRFFGAVTECVLDSGGDPVAYGGDALTIVFDGLPGTTLLDAARCAEVIRALADETAGSPTLAGPVTLQAKIGIARGPVTTAVAHSQTRCLPVQLGPGLDLAVAAEETARPGQVIFDPTTASAASSGPSNLASGANRRSRPATDPADLAPLVHPVVFARLGIGASLIESHRSVTVAFVRFPAVELAGLPSFLGEVAELLSLVEAGGGEIVQVSGGDKGMVAMIVFGAPVARDDDPLRTVETLLEARHRLRIDGVGVATGPVFTALLGSERRRFAANSGPPVNLAARLMQAASQGELVVDSVTWKAAALHLRARGPAANITVKGVEKPVQIWIVAGWRRRRRRARATTSSPLVGRQEELAAVERLLDDVGRASGRSLVLEGEAGVGKTRLVREAADRARTRGVRVVMADAGDHPRGGATGLWRDGLSGVLGLPVRPDRRSWLEALTAALPDARDQIPALGSLIGVRLPASDLTREMPAEIEAEVGQALFVRLIRDAAKKDPILLVVENSHQLDDASQSVLAYVTRSLSGTRVGLLLTRRPGVESGQGALGVVLQVPELAPREAALLAVDIWGQSGGGSAPPWLADAVAKRAGGNPLFVRTVTEATQTSWEPGRPPPTARFAASLTGLLSEQIDRLPPVPHQLLSLLAVARRPLAAEVAEAAMSDHLGQVTAADAAKSLVDLDLVQVESLGGADRYRIRHDVIQETVYEGMSHAERVRLHGLLADQLESHNADPVAVAEHVIHLDDPDRARHWFPLAAASTRAAWSVNEAIKWWQLALPSLLDEDREAAEAELAELLLVGGRPQEVRTVVAGGISSSSDPVVAARRLHARAEAAFLCGELDEGETTVEKVLQLTAGVDEGLHQRASELLIRIRCERGDTLGARSTARTQLSRALSSGDARAIATAHASLGMALLFADLAGEAIVPYEAAREGAAALGDIVMEVHVVSDLAGCYHALRDYTSCVELLATARAAADGIGYRRHLAYNLNNEAELRSTLGDASAAACAAVAMRRSLELGDLSGAADAAHAWVRSVPSLATAVRNWRRIVQIDVALGRSGFAAESGAELALAEARAGHRELALRRADEAFSRARGLELPHVVRRAELARLLAHAGPRGCRSRESLVILLGGLSRMAADGSVSELERAEISVERWRASEASDDRASALSALREVFAIEPSALVRGWFRELGADTPPAPPLLPPPVGIGRTRTTRAQLNAALTQLEEAALALSHRSDSGDL
jgi:class 3 adenylate cyclase